MRTLKRLRYFPRPLEFKTVRLRNVDTKIVFLRDTSSGHDDCDSCHHLFRKRELASRVSYAVVPCRFSPAKRRAGPRTSATRAAAALCLRRAVRRAPKGFPFFDLPDLVQRKVLRSVPVMDKVLSLSRVPEFRELLGSRGTWSSQEEEQLYRNLLDIRTGFYRTREKYPFGNDLFYHVLVDAKKIQFSRLNIHPYLIPNIPYYFQNSLDSTKTVPGLVPFVLRFRDVYVPVHPERDVFYGSRDWRIHVDKELRKFKYQNRNDNIRLYDYFKEPTFEPRMGYLTFLDNGQLMVVESNHESIMESFIKTCERNGLSEQRNFFLKHFEDLKLKPVWKNDDARSQVEIDVESVLEVDSCGSCTIRFNGRRVQWEKFVNITK